MSQLYRHLDEESGQHAKCRVRVRTQRAARSAVQGVYVGRCAPRFDKLKLVQAQWIIFREKKRASVTKRYAQHQVFRHRLAFFFYLYPSVGGLVDACVSCADDSVDIDTVSPESSQIKPVQFHESHFRGSGEWIDHQTYALHKSREVRNQERRGLLLECRCAKG